MSLPPLAIYVHVPWCIRKCPYCDFNSHASKAEDIPETDYLNRIHEDIRQDASLAQGRKAQSVFFGGGTPSLLSAEAIGQIIRWLEQYIGLHDAAEITLEANPGTVEAHRFAGFRAAGVNRLSIGVQSFNDRFLQTLGRIHSAGEAIRAIEIARQAGFDNFNIDLMHGLPEQSEAEALADLHQAVALAPRHISWYQLTIEANTEFYRHPPTLPADETLWDIQQAGQLYLAGEGFSQYEVSAYARASEQSQHNLNYWRYGDYLGFGPGAHGKYSRPLTGGGLSIIRTKKTRLPKDYLNSDRPLVRQEENIGLADRPFDYFINAFRLREAVSLRQFEQRTGVPSATLTPILTLLLTRGLISWHNDLVATTDNGYLHLNDVLSYWLE
ncbi:radical SAM family heme chaperone HemW [Reinekea sp.]|jgi:oxygen-independent coproporphyrinogen-3 oxidase|uniref:radical SAM family heme chaperone HemW n=1 Tax=Reinekea sp. TaxID=1970455 RepID=UPI002A83313B|nr:radical SAM family heme chaperone HemW [Reinekea sp.]